MYVIARREEHEWEDLHKKSAYENDLFFLSQLYEEGWSPRSMV